MYGLTKGVIHSVHGTIYHQYTDSQYTDDPSRCHRIIIPPYTDGPHPVGVAGGPGVALRV